MDDTGRLSFQHLRLYCLLASTHRNRNLSHNKKRSVAGGTVLHWAAASGNTDILGYLLERAVDVNSPCFSGQTPLHVASACGHEVCVRMLLSDNARPDIGVLQFWLVEQVRQWWPRHNFRLGLCFGLLRMLGVPLPVLINEGDR
jgi:ankyrin repeat protein